MALTNLATQNNVQAYQQGQVGSLFGLAQDGDVQAVNKVSGAADYIFTGNTAGAETVNFTVTFATLLKLYASQTSGVTRLKIKAVVNARAAAVANSGYWEINAVFDDISGTMTIVGAQAATVAIEGGATTDPALTNSGSNTLQVAVTTLAAAAVRVELFVDHVQ